VLLLLLMMITATGDARNRCVRMQEWVVDDDFDDEKDV
jgi:hypothetical protein